MSLHPDDGIELAEMLSFIRSWLATDTEHLAPSFRRFLGTDGYDLTELLQDLARFTFLLGGDGEELFGLDST
jgi:hypothetical protein